MPEHYVIGEALSGPHLPSHLYVHVPFCRVRCSYCDFYSETDLSHERVGSVMTALGVQFALWGRLGLPGVLETLYIGGGTPTMMAAGLVGTVRDALEAFPVHANPEVTIEANPDSVNATLIEALAASGVTRVSIGVQSFVDTELAMLGRIHTVDEAAAACKAVTDAGLELSVDLMCGIPRQSAASWMMSVESALQTGANHISIYPLSLEEGTPLQVACDTELAPAPDPDLAADMMVAAEERLRLDGLERYEVASYARPGYESRHNIAYWSGKSYLGVGPSAHGMLDIPTANVVGLCEACPDDAGRIRYAERADLEAWLTGATSEIEILSVEEAAREDVMLALRLTKGVPETQIREASLLGVLEELGERGLVERVGVSDREPRWRTTRRGWLLGNEVFGAVWNSS